MRQDGCIREAGFCTDGCIREADDIRLILIYVWSIRYIPMVPSREPDANTTLWQKLIMPEETRCLYPSAPPWDGGYRWFQSPNIIDLQDYRSAIERKRIRLVLLGGKY
jgi:hypothetical protein